MPTTPESTGLEGTSFLSIQRLVYSYSGYSILTSGQYHHPFHIRITPQAFQSGSSCLLLRSFNQFLFNLTEGDRMAEQKVIEEFIFTRCQYWDSLSCPNHKNAYMQLSIINRSVLFLLNDLAIAELWELCSSCSEFRQK